MLGSLPPGVAVTGLTGALATDLSGRGKVASDVFPEIRVIVYDGNGDDFFHGRG